MTNVPFYACYEWYVEHVKQIKSHKFIYEWNPFFCFKKFKFVLMIKKIDFGLSKYQICFVRLKKRVFGDKYSDMFCDKKKCF